MFFIKKRKNKNYFCQSQRTKETGLTLIELIVTVFIFSIIVIAMLSVFASSIKNQRQSLIYNQILDQASYNMEYISRMLRMAKKVETGPGCNFDGGNLNVGENYELTRGGEGILFKDYRGNCRSFYLQAQGQDRVLRQWEGSSGSDLALTSSVNVEVANFRVVISDAGPTSQPKVTILLKLKAKNISPVPFINLQTTVSQRDLDL